MKFGRRMFLAGGIGSAIAALLGSKAEATPPRPRRLRRRGSLLAAVGDVEMLAFGNGGVQAAGSSDLLAPFENENFNVNTIPGIALPADGTLHHFVMAAQTNSLSVPTSFTVMVNGVASAVVLILPGGDTKELNAAEALAVDAGDVINVQFSIPAGTGQMINPQVNCLFSAT